MVIYSCCDIKSVDAEGCCNTDKHIGFTGFFCGAMSRSRHRATRSLCEYVCGFHHGSICQRVAGMKHTDECTVTTCRAKFLKVRKGGDFFYG